MSWPQLRRLILSRENGCVYCGDWATEVDHVVPRSKGGTDDPSNLVAVCKSCNAAKGTKTLGSGWEPADRTSGWYYDHVISARRG